MKWRTRRPVSQHRWFPKHVPMRWRAALLRLPPLSRRAADQHAPVTDARWRAALSNSICWKGRFGKWREGRPPLGPLAVVSQRKGHGQAAERGAVVPCRAAGRLAGHGLQQRLCPSVGPAEPLRDPEASPAEGRARGPARRA
eukprot:11177607-Lingulodinium_polyedra.AAC.1